MAKHKPCLILNQDYTPLTVVDWRRALCLEIIGKEIPGEGIRVIEHYDLDEDIVESAGGEFFAIPAVAVTSRYIKRKRKISLKKRNLFIRDNKQCQYCGSELHPKTATIDHIIPRSRFEKKVEAHTWENTVISCLRCNSRKDNRTPEQAGMKLLTQPKEPDIGAFYACMAPWSDIPKVWENYVYA